jgi:hypothetical protein
MAKESTERIKARRIRLPVILGVIAGIIVVFFISTLNCRSYFYGVDVCSFCGIERTVDRESIFGLPYYSKTTFKDTAVSRALKARQPQKCHHDWFMLHAGFGNGALLGWSSHADDWTDFPSLKLLIRDDAFAQDLAKMPNPQQVWHTILKAGEHSPKEMDSIIGYMEEGGLGLLPFPQWWKRNEKLIKQLSGKTARENKKQR